MIKNDKTLNTLRIVNIFGLVWVLYSLAIPLSGLGAPLPGHIARQVSANVPICAWLALSILFILPCTIFPRLAQRKETAWMIAGYTLSLAVACIIFGFTIEANLFIGFSGVFSAVSLFFKQTSV